MIQKNGKLSQNDITRGQANSTDMPPDQKSRQDKTWAEFSLLD
jgi:hypothetical protein